MLAYVQTISRDSMTCKSERRKMLRCRWGRTISTGVPWIEIPVAERPSWVSNPPPPACNAWPMETIRKGGSSSLFCRDHWAEGDALMAKLREELGTKVPGRGRSRDPERRENTRETKFGLDR